MGSNYGFSDWLTDMQSSWDYSISVLPWRLLTTLAILFAFSTIASLFLCIWRSFTFDMPSRKTLCKTEFNALTVGIAERITKR